jgi:hypothetical protein
LAFPLTSVSLAAALLDLLKGLRSGMLVNISKQNITRSEKWLRVP